VFDDQSQLSGCPFDMKSARTKPIARWTLDELADQVDDDLNIADSTFEYVDHGKHNAIHDRGQTSHPDVHGKVFLGFDSRYDAIVMGRAAASPLMASIT
jgi:hypothetical protein